MGTLTTAPSVSSSTILDFRPGKTPPQKVRTALCPHCGEFTYQITNEAGRWACTVCGQMIVKEVQL